MLETEWGIMIHIHFVQICEWKFSKCFISKRLVISFITYEILS
jgi:hypothetical protein